MMSYVSYVSYVSMCLMCLCVLCVYVSYVPYVSYVSYEGMITQSLEGVSLVGVLVVEFEEAVSISGLNHVHEVGAAVLKVLEGVEDDLFLLDS